MRRGAELTSALVGAAAAVVLLFGWRVPQGTGTTPAGVTLSAASVPELVLGRTGQFASSTELVADGRSAVEGTLDVRNPDAVRVAIHARLRADTSDLDSAVQVRLDADEVTLYRGPLGGLRSWTRRDVTIDPGDSTLIRVVASLRRGAERWQGRQVIATLELDARSLR
jgi:hypothetical protein